MGFHPGHRLLRDAVNTALPRFVCKAPLVSPPAGAEFLWRERVDDNTRLVLKLDLRADDLEDLCNEPDRMIDSTSDSTKSKEVLAPCPFKIFRKSSKVSLSFSVQLYSFGVLKILDDLCIVTREKQNNWFRASPYDTSFDTDLNPKIIEKTPKSQKRI